MKALSIEKPNTAAVLEQEKPSPGPGELLIRVSLCGVCGTDVHIFRGEYIGSYPIVPGHEFSGTVEAVGAGVKRFKASDRVAVEPNIACNNCEACLNKRQNFCHNWQAVGVSMPGGMAEYVLCPESAAFDIGSLPFESAAFMEPLSCVIHGLNKLSIQAGDRMAVIGAGPIGLQIARVARSMGACTIVMADRNADRLKFAQDSASANETLDDTAALNNDMYDVVVEATGAPVLISEALRAARPGGQVLLFGVAPQGKMAQVEPFNIFRKGLSIHGSYTSVCNSSQALQLLQSGAVKLDDLITHRLPLSRFEHGVECLEQGREGVMKVMLSEGF